MSLANAIDQAIFQQITQLLRKKRKVFHFLMEKSFFYLNIEFNLLEKQRHEDLKRLARITI
jgi:hypothetical protein